MVALDDAPFWSRCFAISPSMAEAAWPRRQGGRATRRRKPIAAGTSARELQIQDDGGPRDAVPPPLTTRLIQMGPT